MRILFKYKLCRWKTTIELYLKNLKLNVRKNAEEIERLNKKLEFLDLRISNLEYFIKKREVENNIITKRKNTLKNIIILILDNKHTTIIIRIIIGIAALIFILEWADKNGMRNDLLHIISGVITK